MKTLILMCLLLAGCDMPPDPVPVKTLTVGGWGIEKFRVEEEHMTCYVMRAHSSSMTCIPDTVKCAPEPKVEMEPGYCVLIDGGVTCYPLKKEAP